MRIGEFLYMYLGIEKKGLNFKMPYEHGRLIWVQKIL